MKRWIALAGLLLTCCAPALGQQVTEIPLTTNHLVYDPVSARIYATVPSSAGADGNSVAVINPTTGKLVRTVYVGSGPDAIAVSNDGQFLYVGFDGSSLVQRVAIATMTPDFSFSLGNGTLGPYHASALAVVPGEPHSVAVSVAYSDVSPSAVDVGIYDDGVARPDTVGGGGSGSLAFNSSGSILYIDSGGLTTVNVTAQGLTAVQSAARLLNTPISYDPTSQLLYGDGQVADPSSDQLKGTFLAAFSPAYTNEYSYAFDVASTVPDPLKHAVYVLYSPFLGTSDVIIGAYDAGTLLPIGSAVVPVQTSNEIGEEYAGDLTIINTNTLAFRSPVGDVTLVHYGSLPDLSGLRLSSPVVSSGQTVTGTITLARPAPASGVTVLLSSSNYVPSLSLPTSVLFPAGSTQESFSIVADTIASSQSTLISAGYGVQTLSAHLFAAQNSNSQEYPPNIRVVYLPHNSIIANPTSGTVYATVPSTEGSEGNSIVRISPQSFGHSSLGFIGSEPGLLALSDDGAYLYTSLNGAGSIASYDLSTGDVGAQFSLGNDSYSGPRYAEDMAVMPGESDAVAVACAVRNVSPGSDGVRVFVDGTAATGVVNGFDLLAVNPSIPGRIYGYDNEDTSFDFGRMNFGNSGLSLINSQWDLLYGFGGRIAFDNGMVYGSNGGVIDPETFTLLGTFPGLNSPSLVFPDSADGYVYFVTPNSIGSGTYSLNVYDPNTYLLVAAYLLTNITGTPDSIGRTSHDHVVFGMSSGQIVFINATPARLIGFALDAAAVTGGQSTSATITLSNVAPIGGIVVTLKSSNASVTVPSSVAVPAGSQTATFSISTSSVTAAEQATIDAKYNGITHAAVLTINP